ncbi:MAG: hypothetical protein JRH10_05985 [Deltaproteobacteria bacterium]|nr:hypothetical protein [Deltaproteobacteria bacterium]MBW2447951.1 hypothetical protein [Deltaproteobacteria bacterium]
MKSKRRIDREREFDSCGGRQGEDPAAFAPYPEIVDTGPAWQVLDSTTRPWLPSIGVTDKTRRVLYTPLRHDGDAVTRHEMAHVLFSPTPAMPRVRFEPLVLHAVEDARVNLALAGAGFALDFDTEYLADIRLRLARDRKHGEVAIFLLRSVACLGTNAFPLVEPELQAASPRLREWAEGWLGRVRHRLEEARRRCGEAAAPFPAGLALARELARDLDRHGLLQRPLQAPELGCCVAVPTEEGDEAAGGGRMGRLAEKLRGKRSDSEDREVKPGAMTTREAPMPRGRSLGTRAIGRRPRPAAEGCHLMRPHRHAIDRKVFRRAVRWRGGAVLVDTSGSMHLPLEGLDALVDASRGAALVAIYSGSEREGELRVVARGGRRANEADLEPFGSGNIVDVPALEWLARQPEPRLWVSDGGVTGEMDRGSREIRRRCAEIVRRGRIERLDSAEEAAKRLAGGPRAPKCKAVDEEPRG